MEDLKWVIHVKDNMIKGKGQNNAKQFEVFKKNN